MFINNANVASGKAAITANDGAIAALYENEDTVLAGVIEKSVHELTFGNSIANRVIFDTDDIKDDAQEAAYKAAYDAAIKAGETETDASTLAKNASDVAGRNAYDTVMEAADTAALMGVLGGAFNVALDYNDQVAAALDRRTSALNPAVRGEVGVTPWVDVFGTANEGKRLYGEGVGYSADIYGAVLGFDYTASCGGVLGLAFNVGTADANSEGLGNKVDNDSDFYGISLYAAKQFGGFNVKADLGYTQASNDLSTSGVLGSFKESLDADVWTFGLGTEYVVNAGAFNVMPHAGIRFTSIDLDDSEFVDGADYDAMGVWQMPLGVAFSGTFETNGWKIAPMADVSVVPAFGDKDAEASFIGGINADVRVVDTNPVQGTLGVNATNGAFTFGLNYRLTAGGDDRMNNSFNANLRYAF